MMIDPWYEVVSADATLSQGDLIFDCPVLTWDSDVSSQTQDLQNAQSLKDLATGCREDVVVMTQACDLEHGKVSNVVLCPHIPISLFRDAWLQWMNSKNQNPSEKAWRRACDDIADGYVWNQSFLNSFAHTDITTEIRVVDFQDIFTIPRPFLEKVLIQSTTPRLRLLPPYREHLSQAFARFFMRVGLPQAVDRTW